MNQEKIKEAFVLDMEKSYRYCELLLKYNKIHNISGCKSKKDVQENIDDSLYPLRYLSSLPKSAIDIGSGAGFPAIPLAMALEHCSFTLFEPIAKKSAFLHLVINELSLTNVKIETKRVELAPKFVADLITSRAVGDTSMVVELSHGFYDQNTTFLLYKGLRAKEEISCFADAKIYKRGLRRYVFLKGLSSYA